MIDRQLRRELSEDLRQLVVGTISNDEFDDAYFEKYQESEDLTVRKIGQFGWSLYSDTHKYRLRGRYAVDAETRRAAARCVLLLRSSLEYEWPEPPRSYLRELADACVLMGIAVGAATTIIWSMLLLNKVKDVGFMIPIGFAGVALLIVSIWYLAGGSRRSRETPAWRQWRTSGDYEVWPFLRRSDFETANRSPRAHILATVSRDYEL